MCKPNTEHQTAVNSPSKVLLEYCSQMDPNLKARTTRVLTMVKHEVVITCSVIVGDCL